MAKIIAVIGATGTQGGSVVRRFLQLPGWQVRGITRNPASAVALELQTLGVDVVAADLDDVASLDRAFRDVHAIFGVTDFWQFKDQPRTRDLAASKGITWNEACYLREIEQGTNIIAAAARAADEGCLEKLVFSSLADHRKGSHGEYKWAYHFDAKARIVEYLEDTAKSKPSHAVLLEKTSYVQMGFYLDNWKKNPIFAPRKQPNGSFLFRWMVADRSQSVHAVPFVHPPRDTGFFVEVLVLTAPPKTTMLGTCALIPYTKFVQLWAEILQVSAAIEPVTVEGIDSQWPGGLGREVAESASSAQKYGWDAGSDAILPKDAGVQSELLTDIASYIAGEDWSSILDDVV